MSAGRPKAKRFFKVWFNLKSVSSLREIETSIEKDFSKSDTGKLSGIVTIARLFSIGGSCLLWKSTVLLWHTW